LNLIFFRDIARHRATLAASCNYLRGFKPYYKLLVIWYKKQETDGLRAKPEFFVMSQAMNPEMTPGQS
jgi:hypothetical protein